METVRSTDPETIAMTLRDRLRRDTAGAHARLDRGVVPRRLLGEGLTLDGYARILHAYARAHATLEPRLAGFAELEPIRVGPSALPEFVPRLPGLERDLAGLAAAGFGPSPTDVGPPERAAHGTEATGSADARYLGLRYVLDGATRGADGIARRLQRTLPELRELEAFEYWTVQRRAARAWPAVVERISIVVPEAFAGEAVHEAIETFAEFERAFGEVPT